MISLYSRDKICPIKDILYMRRTAKLFYTNTGGKNVRSIKFAKTSFKQTNERPTGPNNTAIPKQPTNAWISSNNKNPQKLRSLLRPKHNISVIKFP